MQHPNRYQNKSEGWGGGVCARGVGRVGGGRIIREYSDAYGRQDRGDTIIYMYIYTYIYRERDRERESETDTECERERDRESKNSNTNSSQ